jgi:hypothetical protein
MAYNLPLTLWGYGLQSPLNRTDIQFSLEYKIRKIQETNLRRDMKQPSDFGFSE